MEWLPIESAPKDGTPILLTDGRLFAGGRRAHRIEPEEMIKGYGDQPPPYYSIPDDFMTVIPNPRAGERIEWWELFGCSAFDSDADTFDADYDSPVGFEPSAWMPLPAPPARQG